MKNIITLIAGALIFTACSSPKYSYYFDHYDYNSGKKAVALKTEIPNAGVAQSPLTITPEMMSASTAPDPIITKEVTPSKDIESAKKELVEKWSNMTKTEKKEFKQELKKYVKSIKQKDSGESVHAAKVWDHDLKMATIFGIVGAVLTSLYFASPVFYILGIAALVVAIVFLIKWLSRQ